MLELQVHQVELDLQLEQLGSNEAQLAEELQGYRDLFERAPVAYLRVGRQGWIVEAKEAANAMLAPPDGADTGHAEGRRFGDLLRHRDRAAFSVMLQALDSDHAVASCAVQTIELAAAGEANWNINAMARGGLREALGPALKQAARDGETLHLHGVDIRGPDGTLRVDVTVQTFDEPAALRGMTIIVFRDLLPGASPADTEAPASADQARRQSALDEIQRLHEEARAHRSALQSSNEQLQSTNEELQNKLDDLSLAQSDIGRPLSDLTTSLQPPDLYKDARETLRTLRPSEKQIRSDDDRWFSVRDHALPPPQQSHRRRRHHPLRHQRHLGAGLQSLSADNAGEDIAAIRNLPSAE